jgi:RND superfamily putative drug exporter
LGIGGFGSTEEPYRAPSRTRPDGAVAHSGRVVFAVAGVMVAVFFTFAPSAPLPPEEMGLVLGLGVLSTPR